MKVGIITWFHYENYGTKLQALALQKYIKEKGHSAYILNFIRQKEVASKETLFVRLFCKKNLPARVLYKLCKQFNKRQLSIKSAKMSNVIEENCNLTTKITTEEQYIDVCNGLDLLICGSDQIWNPNWFHKYYYADFQAITCKKASYAPSFGVQMFSAEEIETYKKTLGKFDLLSCREQIGNDFIHQSLGLQSVQVVDPTMLFDKQQWSFYLQLKCLKVQPYILCYFLSDNINHWMALQKFAKEKKLDLRIIPMTPISFFMPGKKEKSAGVEDFLSLMQNAEYVITDSFHAVIFSLIFEKKFVVFERHRPDTASSQNSRIYSLLDGLGISDVMEHFNADAITKDGQFDYNLIHSQINVQRMASEKYIKRVLDIIDS